MPGRRAGHPAQQPVPTHEVREEGVREKGRDDEEGDVLEQPSAGEPGLVGFDLPAWLAAGICLTLYMGCFSTEIFRGGIISIDKGQREAARTLGLSQWQAMYRIILPQAARLMVRPLGVNLNMLIKATALVAAISVIELTYTAQRYIGSTYKPFEMFLLAGILYMIIIYVTGRGVAWLDRKVQIN